MTETLAKTKKENALKRLWNYFSTYEKIWYLSIVVLTIVVAILFPTTVNDEMDNDGSISIALIMSLYLLDTFLNITCELLISKQSKWNFIVSLGIEITEIVTLIILSRRFATMATTLFFWIPCDIISFINWNKHKDKKDENLTIVRTLKGWQEGLIITGIVLWTVGVGYLLSIIGEDGLLGADTIEAKIVCYLDAAVSAVGVCNGLAILFRFREQWIAWYIDATLELVINIISGEWVLIPLKIGYFTNTTYGYIKWTKYIKSHENQSDASSIKQPENLSANN